MAAVAGLAGHFIGKKRGSVAQSAREQRLIESEKELVKAEGRQASPFGNPQLTRKQQAQGGGGFTPAAGAVSDEARQLAKSDREEAKQLLDKQVASDLKKLGKKRSTDSKPRKPGSLLSKPSSSILSSQGPAQMSKQKLGV